MKTFLILLILFMFIGVSCQCGSLYLENDLSATGTLRVIGPATMSIMISPLATTASIERQREMYLIKAKLDEMQRLLENIQRLERRVAYSRCMAVFCLAVSLFCFGRSYIRWRRRRNDP